MNRRTLLVVIAALALIGGLTFTAAELWVAPGHPTPGHQAIAGDCFACHQPFRGTPVERCTACHAFDRDGVVDGRRTGSRANMPRKASPTCATASAAIAAGVSMTGDDARRRNGSSDGQRPGGVTYQRPFVPVA
jgi:hypothetical protein